MQPSPIEFLSRRSPVLSQNGIVSTSHPLAAQAGVSILQEGGNAADAAVAAAAVLNVVEPTMTGIGGDCFALFFDGSTKQISSVNGSGRAPKALNIATIRQESNPEIMPILGPHAVTVPGAAYGWYDTIQRHGCMTLSSVLAPAIRIAEEGHPVAPIISQAWKNSENLLKTASPNGNEMLIKGRAPKTGEIFTNPNLGRVFRELASGGPEAFYSGKSGLAIAKVLQELGGTMTKNDLTTHRSSFEDPISTTYRNYQVYECAPNGQGLTALIALNIVEGYDLGSMDRLSAKYLHLLIEAVRLAFADTRWYVADPEHVTIPVNDLLSKDYAAKRRKLIESERTIVDPKIGSPVLTGDTAYISVVDKNGNACSFICSNYMGFGTGIIPQECGFSLQNRGAGFQLDPDHPNALGPGKRPYHTIIPAMSTHENGELYACFGVMGGFMQPQGHLQVLTNLIDHKLDPQAAVDAPRFCITDDPPNSPVYLETGIPKNSQKGLIEMGHPVETIRNADRIGIPGKAQVIYRDSTTGALWAGSDPRSDGAAIGI